MVPRASTRSSIASDVLGIDCEKGRRSSRSRLARCLLLKVLKVRGDGSAFLRAIVLADADAMLGMDTAMAI